MALISLDTPEQWDVTLPLTDVQNSIAVDYHWDRKLIFFTDVNSDVIRFVLNIHSHNHEIIIYNIICISETRVKHK